MSALTIYPNPKCGKSRATLALLLERGITPRTVEYLKAPPSAAELQAIVTKLGIRPEGLIRKGEDPYRTRYAGKTLTDEQWIVAMLRREVTDASDRRQE